MFTLRLCLTVVAAIVAAALIAPLAGLALAHAGFNLRFPRIFDRVVMVTAAAALLYEARDLKLLTRLKNGFAHPAQNWSAALWGIAIGSAAIVVLWSVGCFLSPQLAALTIRWRLIGSYLASGVVIAIIEEGFFRALLLDGMAEDFGPRTALILSSLIYAFSHQVHSQGHYVLRGFHPLAGFVALGASMQRLAATREAAPVLLGLFLLGLLLGDAYLATGTVYFSAGVHTSLVVGQKLWHQLVPRSLALPHWLAGFTGPPLIGGAAAWVVTLVLLGLVRPMTRHWARGTPPV